MLRESSEPLCMAHFPLLADLLENLGTIEKLKKKKKRSATRSDAKLKLYLTLLL